MAGLRLEHIGGFFIAGGILVVLILSALLLYVLWPQICLLLRAFWRRYFAVGDWRAAMNQLADQSIRVSDYQPGRHGTRVMSTRENAPIDRPVAVLGNGSGPGPARSHPPVPQGDLTYREAVREAASIKVGGKWWISGKRLYASVGGNHDEFLAIVREVRGGESPEAPPATTPIAGRATNAVFADPDLVYRPPDGDAVEDDADLTYRAP